MDPGTSTSSIAPFDYRNILCVEEHGEMSILLAKMLNQSMCKVLHIKDKTEAEVFLKGQDAVLVVIENNFYDNGGLTYAARLKAMFPSIKLMMLSGENYQAEKASHTGVDIFLTRPFTKSQLLDSIRMLLDIS